MNINIAKTKHNTDNFSNELIFLTRIHGKIRINAIMTENDLEVKNESEDKSVQLLII